MSDAEMFVEQPTFSPYLDGNFAPVFEEVTIDDLQVIGELPHDLAGMFIRNGPNPQFPPKGRYHWFDGDGMLHGVRLQDGKASYRNRYIRTRGFEVERAAGKAIWSGLAEMPDFNNEHGMMFKNAANTALIWHEGRLLATWEGGEPHEIVVPGLETVGPVTFNGKLASAFTAHPKVDPQTGEMMFFGYNPVGPEYVHYSVVSAEGELLRTIPIDLPRAVMMHDFAITSHYTIFMDLPLVFDVMRMMEGLAPFYFDGDVPSRFGIMPRHGTSEDMKWFEAPPCYVFHTLNAYEDGDEVVLVACRMETTSALTPPGHSTEHGGHSTNVQPVGDDRESARLFRWRFNLATGDVKEEALDDVTTDFPRFHEGFMGSRMRYGYTSRLAPHTPGGVPLFDGLLKYDLQSHDIDFHPFGEGRHGGEAVFVPRPNAVHEDEGWLMTLLFDHNTGESELLIVNADDMDGEPAARVIIPKRVPYGFHGTWVDGRLFA